MFGHECSVIEDGNSGRGPEIVLFGSFASTVSAWCRVMHFSLLEKANFSHWIRTFTFTESPTAHGKKVHTSYPTQGEEFQTMSSLLSDPNYCLSFIDFKLLLVV